jgi:pyruvate kinase
MTQTRIIATLGPASDSPETVRALIRAGVDIFRINFSHGSRDEQRRHARTVREAARDLHREVGLLGDLAGPKIRCGVLVPDPLALERGGEVRLTSGGSVGRCGCVPVTYEYLHLDVKPGQEIALDDGRIRLRVERIEDRDVICRVTEGGLLYSKKGVNLPDTELRIGAVTDADSESIALAVAEGFDFLGLSFVSTAGEVRLARSIVEQNGGRQMLIAKIERRAAIPNLEAILDAADGAMVARGDLGVELPIERVPLLQKRIIKACNCRAKPVITATQMLESMIESPRPTRAETTDIANAILDGSDAVMLSAETAVGEYPVETVATMDRIAEAAEEGIDHRQVIRACGENLEDENAAISQAASQLALDLNVDAIVCLTAGGSTPRRIAPHRPACPIIAVSANLATVRQLLLSWGIDPIHLPELDAPALSREHSGAEAVAAASSPPAVDIWIWRLLELCAREGKLKPGQRVILVAGLPLGQPGTTNFIHVATVPESNGPGA